MGKHSAPRRPTPRRRVRLMGVTSIMLGVMLLAAGVALAAGPYDIEVPDNTTSAQVTLDDGAIVYYIGDNDVTFGSSGSGIFDSFVRLQADGTESGYNTDGILEFDTKSGGFTRSILLSEVPTIEVDGITYWEFFSDINDGNSTPLISLDEFELFLTEDPNLSGYPFTGTADQIYDFNDHILINDVNQGSGRGDLRYLVPVPEAFEFGECTYGNPACTDYVILYSAWGGYDPAYNSDGGFEEWKVKRYPILTVSKDIAGSYETPVTWELSKSSDGDYDRFAGDSTGDHAYTIDPTPILGASENTMVSGTITIVGDEDSDVDAYVTDLFNGSAATIVGCSVPMNLDGSYTVPEDGSITCTYELALDGPVDGTNVAKANFEVDGVTLVFKGAATILAANYEETLTGDPEVNITDDNGTPGDPSDDNSFGPFDSDNHEPVGYTNSWTCPLGPEGYVDGEYSYTVTNTATIDETGDSDTATVNVNCYRLSVDKSAEPTWTKDWDWTINKTSDPEVLHLFDGQSGTTTWQVDVTKTLTDEVKSLIGTITIYNPAPMAADVTVVDTYPGAVVAVDCPADSVPAAGSLVCSYVATFAGDPIDGTNTAAVTHTDTGVIYTGTAAADFTLVETDASIDVGDDRGSTTWSFDDTGSETYTEDFDCESVEYTDGVGSFTITNLATILVDGPSDDATVDVNCYRLSVEKTADPTWTKGWAWDITKTAEPTAIQLFDGQSGTINWTIDVTKTLASETKSLIGDITIHNPAPIAAPVTVEDTFPGTTIGVTCPADSVPAQGSLTCTYASTGFAGDPADGTNTATATVPGTGVIYAGEAFVDFTLAESYPDVTVDDDRGATTWDFADSGTVGYSETVNCESVSYTGGVGSFTATNTATIIETGDDSTASSVVTCYQLTAEKSVTPEYTRTFDYTIDKKAMYYASVIDPGSRTEILPGQILNLMPGQAYWLEWDVTVDDNGYVDSNHRIDTAVTVYNPAGMDATGVNIVDAAVGMECLGVTVPAGGSYVCTAEDFLTDTTLVANTATVTMAGKTHAQPSASWNWDTPTELVNDLVDVSDLFNGSVDLTGRLVPQPATVAWSEVAGGLSKTFTLATMLSSDPLDNPDYLLSCYDNTITNSASVLDYTATASVTVYVQCGGACTLTQGYWKTHSAVGPKGWHDNYARSEGDWKHRDDTWDMIQVWNYDGTAWSQSSGNEFSSFFLSGQKYWEVQWTAPQGDKYYNLAHQYIAAQLNIAAAVDEGSSFGALPQEVQDAYNAATDWFKTNSPTDKFHGKAAKDVTYWAGVLASFNEGMYPGWPHCDDSPESVTDYWGSVY